MSRSDFWGNIPDNAIANGGKKEYCHHSLNRCMTDPHLNIVDKLPGDTCINNYECLSKKCVASESGHKFC